VVKVISQASHSQPNRILRFTGCFSFCSPKIPSDVRKARGIARILERFDQTEADRVIAFEEKYQ